MLISHINNTGNEQFISITAANAADDTSVVDEQGQSISSQNQQIIMAHRVGPNYRLDAVTALIFAVKFVDRLPVGFPEWESFAWMDRNA